MNESQQIIFQMEFNKFKWYNQWSSSNSNKIPKITIELKKCERLINVRKMVKLIIKQTKLRKTFKAEFYIAIEII